MNLQDKVDDLDKIIRGNGGLGLNTRMAIVEDFIKEVRIFHKSALRWIVLLGMTLIVVSIDDNNSLIKLLKEIL